MSKSSPIHGACLPSDLLGALTHTTSPREPAAAGDDRSSVSPCLVMGARLSYNWKCPLFPAGGRVGNPRRWAWTIVLQVASFTGKICVGTVKEIMQGRFFSLTRLRFIAAVKLSSSTELGSSTYLGALYTGVSITRVNSNGQLYIVDIAKRHTKFTISVLKEQQQRVAPLKFERPRYYSRSIVYTNVANHHDVSTVTSLSTHMLPSRAICHQASILQWNRTK